MEREISIILKVKGAAQAKKAVEDVFNNEVLKKMGNFNVGLKKTGDGMQRVGRTSKQASTGVMSFNKALGRGLSILYLYNRAWSTFGSQFEEGLQLERASEQFSLNVGNVNKMLPELRSATRGVVADFDLLRTSSRAVQQGLSGNRLAETFKMATIASQKLGMSATDTINTITQAITRQDEGALNTLGIISKTDQAYLQQIAILHKHGGVQARALAVQMRADFIMSRLRQNFGGMNSVQEDGLMILDRLRASWKNFRAELGQTLGHALVPMAKALTVVLDQMTRLLDKMNNTRGFRAFVQVAGTLAVLWGTTKFIRGVQSVMRLFDVMGRTDRIKNSTKHLIDGLKWIQRTDPVKGTSSRLKDMLWYVKNLPSGLKEYVNVLRGRGILDPKVMFRSIRSLTGIKDAVWGIINTNLPLLKWGGIFTIVAGAAGSLWKVLSKIGTSFSVFFQLLNNYDENTGLSKVLREDAEALGTWYNRIENFAKKALYVWAGLKGAFSGFIEGIEAGAYPLMLLGKGIGWVFEKAMDLIMRTDRNALVLQSTLSKIENTVKNIVKYLTAMFSGAVGGAAVGSLFGPLGTIFGGVAGGVAGLASAAFRSDPTSEQRPTPQPQASTQVTSPEPRAMNLDYSNDWSEILNKIDKKLETQNEMMEMEAQNQAIRESQNQARNNIQVRR